MKYFPKQKWQYSQRYRVPQITTTAGVRK